MVSMTDNDFVYIDTIKKIVEKRAESCPHIRFCQTEDLHKNWAEWADFGRTLYVFAGNSDYGVSEQASNHPHQDLLRSALYGVDWEQVLNQKAQYFQVPVGPACNINNCRPQDKYVVKMERFAQSTFEDLPPNIILFSANLNTEHPRMNWLPFGLNSDEPGRSLFSSLFQNKPKKKGLLYVNFQPHTHERIQLRNFWKGKPWVTYRENVPVDQYLVELAEHEYVLSPAGNGLDCYRNYEAIYLDTIPILSVSPFSIHFLKRNLPVMVIDNLFDISPKLLEENKEEISRQDDPAGFLKASSWSTLLDSLG